MSIGWYLPVVVFVGIVLWVWGGILDSVMATLFFSLFGGGAVVTLGGASIQPVSLMLLFLLVHVILSLPNRSSITNAGLRAGLIPNGYFAFYCFYGAATAFLLPKIFARSMVLPPMLINKADIYYTSLLGPSRQNLTTAVYLMGAVVASVCAGIASATPKSRNALVNWSLLISWMHIGFGVAGVALTKVGGEHIINFFRNAKYAELDETTHGLVRINGILPEPSSYAAYGFGWFVFATELWLRQVRPKWTGPTAAGLLIMLVLCTSTTGYISLGFYAAVMAVRWLVAGGGLRQAKLVIIAMSGLAALAFGLAAMAFVPSIAHLVGQLASNLVLHKLDSESGVQRTFWVKAGITAFVKSYGLGVGAGSFRCSSLLFAILGSTGVIGFTAFAAHILAVLRPLRASTYQLSNAPESAVAVSAAWAACIGLAPALVSAPGPDPSVVFSLLGGLALGWHFQAAAGRQSRGQAATGDLTTMASAVAA